MGQGNSDLSTRWPAAVGEQFDIVVFKANAGIIETLSENGALLGQAEGLGVAAGAREGDELSAGARSNEKAKQAANATT